jgi:regulator of protease activity HflC (stomatin/prohibitin superfamily)
MKFIQNFYTGYLNMKKNNLKNIFFIFSIIGLSACSKVPAGYKGVIVNLYGSEKGVAEEPVGVGRYYVGINKEIYLFPTFLQNYTWTSNMKDDESITMQTSEGLSISADVGITYNIRPENVVKVFQKYRLGIDEITNTFLRNMVRDSMNQVASTMTVEQIYGSNKEKFITKVNLVVKEEAMNDGIDVDKIYLIGSFKLPQTVIDSINSKIQATQNAMKVENEIATAKAEAQKTIIEAQAKAEANFTLSKSLTPEFLQYNALQKWNGILPQVTSQAVPFVTLPKI